MGHPLLRKLESLEICLGGKGEEKARERVEVVVDDEVTEVVEEFFKREY